MVDGVADVDGAARRSGIVEPGTVEKNRDPVVLGLDRRLVIQGIMWQLRTALGTVVIEASRFMLTA